MPHLFRGHRRILLNRFEIVVSSTLIPEFGLFVKRKHSLVIHVRYSRIVLEMLWLKVPVLRASAPRPDDGSRMKKVQPQVGRKRVKGGYLTRIRATDITRPVSHGEEERRDHAFMMK